MKREIATKATDSRATVLLLSTSGSRGGMERIVCTLAAGLHAHNWRVRAVFPRGGSDGELAPWCERQGVDVSLSELVLDAAAPHSLRSAWRIARLVRESKADIVSIHFGAGFLSMFDLLGIRIVGGTRVVATVHGAESPSHRKRTASRLAAMLCHSVVGVSQATCDLLQEVGIPEHRIRKVANGVEVPSERISKLEARSRLGIDQRAFVVLSAGRLVVSKRIADVIEAFQKLPPDPESPNVLLIAGDGPERRNLALLASESSTHDVRFVGYKSSDAMHLLYSAADVFVLTSTEGFGLVYAEAALRGVPSIASRFGGASEVVIDGRGGFLVKSGDQESLAEAIARCGAAPGARSMMGEQARTHVEDHFNVTDMVRRYDALFRSALNKGKAKASRAPVCE